MNGPGEVHGFGGAVVSPHVLATQAGMRTLHDGGSAVDAAIASNAVQGVVAPETCGIGGDLFALVWQPGSRTPATLDSSGTAGSGASADQLRDDGHRELPKRHPAAVTIPGCVAGWSGLHERFGKLPLERLLSSAIRLAEDGFPASTEFVRATRATEGDLRGRAPGAQLLTPQRSYHRGERVRRPNLAATLTRIGVEGPAAFYSGAVARDVSRAVDDRITLADLADYRPEWIEPARLEVFGHVGWTIPPSSQGYLTLGTLGVLERVAPDWTAETAEQLHLEIEAYRSMAWERDGMVADRNHAPHEWTELLSPERLDLRASQIDRSVAGRWPHPEPGSGGTAYMCAIDGEGLAVSLIQSNFYGLGTTIGAGDSGFILHNRGAGFNLIAGHPNELGPGKRPLHTLSPTLWTTGGRLTTLLGTRGGHQQPQILAHVAADLFGRGATPAEAQDSPRWTIDAIGPGTKPDIKLEGTVPASVVAGLERRGHTVSVQQPRMGGWGPVSLITVTDDGLRTAVADPRVDTAAAAAI